MITTTVQNLSGHDAVGRLDELSSMIRFDDDDSALRSSDASHLRERLARIVQMLKDTLDPTGVKALIRKLQMVSVAAIEFHR